MANRIEYKAFKKRNVTILGTYDDHDFGLNNFVGISFFFLLFLRYVAICKGRDFPDKDASGQLLMDFLGESAHRFLFF